MDDVHRELNDKWARTDALTRQTHPELVGHLEAVIDLFRSGFNNLSGQPVRDEAHHLSVLLLNVVLPALESGYANALHGYYQPAGSDARILLEHLAHLMYFERRPVKAIRALVEPDFKVAVKNALEEHPNPEVGASLAGQYSVLIQVTHPYKLSRDLGIAGGKLRVSAFDPAHGGSALYTLVELGIRVAQYLRDEVEKAQTNQAWLQRYDKVVVDWMDWRSKQQPHSELPVSADQA